MRAWLIGWFLAAAAVTGAKAPATRSDQPTPQELATVERLVRAADVLGIGEAHDNPVHHAIQSLVLERLVAAGERPVIAFEMLTEEQQAAVDEAMRAASSAQDIEQRLGWRDRGWPDFAMYYPLFETAQRNVLPVLAADLSAEARRTISRGGLGAVPDAERARVVSRLPPDPAREEALQREIQTVHCGLLPGALQATMAEAWHARNVTMARRIAGAVSGGRKVVFIAGRAHLASDSVPGQLEALRPGTRVRVIDLVERPDTTPLANADLVLTTEGVSRPDECAELRRHPPKWN